MNFCRGETRELATGNATCVGYYRTSSATNVGAEKDSLPRQQEAVRRYAKAHRLEVVREFYDSAISGADPVTERPGFAAMLNYLLGNGARIVLVENASRFARDLAVQIAGHDLLKSRGISLVPVDAPNHFQDETPTATMVRSILGAVSQFEKEALVLKLRRARERKRATTGRCEGRKPTIPPDVIQTARRLARRNPRTGRARSLREIGAELAALGMLNANGKPFGAESVRRLLKNR